jgi:CRP/FNR family cyclic AMP-dependent transcriptional regulator
VRIVEHGWAMRATTSPARSAATGAARCFTGPMEWPLLSSLSQEDRQEFLALGRRRTFARGEIVCHAGDPADSLHLVVGGRLSVRVSLDSGDTVTINVLGPGDSFGELALLSADGHRTATITALEDAETTAIGATAFQQLCQHRPGVQRALAVLLAGRVDELSQRLLEMAYVGVDRRLYRRLLELSGDYAAGGRAVVPLTQAQLADLVGGTRPTVNQALQRLVDQGIVALGRGRVEILDLARLRAKAGR